MNRRFFISLVSLFTLGLIPSTVKAIPATRLKSTPAYRGESITVYCRDGREFTVQEWQQSWYVVCRVKINKGELYAISFDGVSLLEPASRQDILLSAFSGREVAEDFASKCIVEVQKISHGVRSTITIARRLAIQ